MSLIGVEMDEHVALVTLNSGENRFNLDFCDAYIDVLDRVEKETDAKTLVVTSAHEKIFSNGIDLDWFMPIVKRQNTDAIKQFLYRMNDLLLRILTYPMVTIAVINGHAFAGGAVMSCAFDFRFMRSDRGYFCLPEVDLGIPFPPGNNAILKKALPLPMLIEMQLTGRRLTAAECEQQRIVRKACHMDELMQKALEYAKAINKERAIVSEMKRRLYKDIIRAIEVEDRPFIEAVNIFAK